MSRKMNALICVAHPDDEAIYFGGLIASQAFHWTVVCVTDGNADGLGASRKKQFAKSCQSLKVKSYQQLSFPDIFENRLDVKKLGAELASLGRFDRVFTHGVLGEYGHPHHQDVSFAVHQAFCETTPVYSVAQNLYPDLKVNVSEKVFELKTKILLEIYAGETKRFLNFLPVTSFEGYVRVTWSEVNELYQFIIGSKRLQKKRVAKYQRLFKYIQARDFELKSRPF